MSGVDLADATFADITIPAGPPAEGPATETLPITPEMERQERLAEASGVSVADRLAAHYKALQARADTVFAVPGWEHLRLGLRLRKFSEGEARGGNDNVALILRATSAVVVQEEDGSWTPLDGGWKWLAAHVIGDPGMGEREIVRHIFDPKDPSNPMAIGLFADDIIRWMANQQTLLERTLGE